MPLYAAITEDGFVFDPDEGEDREAVSVTGDTFDNDEATVFAGLAAANLI
jgi:hypothetical protein